MKFLKTLLFLILPFSVFSQTLSGRLSAALSALAQDDQFTHASVSMYVVDTKTNTVAYEKNAQLGLAAASTQKIITSISAFALLGKTFTYKTIIEYDGKIENNILTGNLYFTGSGDPTSGSWRWNQTEQENIKKQIVAVLKTNHITGIRGDCIIDDSKWESQATPRGWIWEDVGNYYGAGVWGINWHENQYDLILKPGKKTGDEVSIIKTEPVMEGVVLLNELKTGREGSGDNSIIYLPENALSGTVRGTVPAGKETFIVKGSIPYAPALFLKTITTLLAENKIEHFGKGKLGRDLLVNRQLLKYKPTLLYTLQSPTIDSINYWFLQKSVNLFGEAFIKTIAYEKTGFGSMDTGLSIIRNFWNSKGIQKSALKIIDGSGLSPANRITTHALVTALQFAKKQHWFSSFYSALPYMHGIKMKDGYISGVRAYTGYVKNKTGVEYTFAFIVNNFDGSPATVREKMWRVLDILK